MRLKFLSNAQACWLRAAVGTQPLPGALPDWVKTAAVAAMVLDHVNTILLQRSEPLLWALGRCAFPLFALLVAWNHAFRSRSPARYGARLLFWALLSTPIYDATFGFDFLHLNPLFTLALGLLAAELCVRKPALRAPTLAGLVTMAAIEAWTRHNWFSYGTAGVLLVAALALWLRERGPVNIGLIALALPLLNPHWDQPVRALVAAGVASVSIWLALAHMRPVDGAAQARPGWVRRELLYAFYPAHLLALLVAWNWLNVWR